MRSLARPFVVAVCAWGSACAPQADEVPFAGQIDATIAPCRKGTLLAGDTADGAVGDVFLRNERLVAIIERPGRRFGPGPYGGNLIDVGPLDSRRDVLGEIIPCVQLGMTPAFDQIRIINDGLA